MDMDRPLDYNYDDLSQVKFPAPTKFGEMFKVLFGIRPIPPDFEPDLPYFTRHIRFVLPFQERYSNNTAGRCLFTTKCGRMGIGAFHMRKGDAVCVLYGSPFCFILRPHGSNYKLIGDAYVHGVMHGELFEGNILKGERDFVLC